KLRDLADPYFTGNASSGIKGGIASSASAQALPTQPLPMQKSAKSVFQSAIPSTASTGFTLTEQATLTEKGDINLEMVPNFQQLHHADVTPVITLALIPGGKSK